MLSIRWPFCHCLSLQTYLFLIGEPIASAQNMLIRNITLKYNQDFSPQNSDECGGLIWQNRKQYGDGAILPELLKSFSI